MGVEESRVADEKFAGEKNDKNASNSVVAAGYCDKYLRRRPEF